MAPAQALRWQPPVEADARGSRDREEAEDCVAKRRHDQCSYVIAVLRDKPDKRRDGRAPMIEKQRNPDVASSEAVDRSKVIVKITGNMIELNSPIASATVTCAHAPTAKT
jgi:hypothetical protein